MNKYNILDKNGELAAVELGCFDTPDKTKKLEDQGYKSLDLEVTALSESKAIESYKSGKYKENPDNNTIKPQQRKNVKAHYVYETNDFIVGLLSVVGWLSLIGGVFLTFLLISESGILIGIYGIAVSLLGMLLLASSIITRALIEIAVNTRKDT
ncbi:hypothetical protein [Oceanisphaera pacifica]|uniref:Uncharacterized protein n=1 Tax=Oceanisphaera pacifica TaxID=2818389 RepID=A0ABS3NJD5_9GAMM|nr:hypothetical protein [Oceanisphaera pacifica]MBO1520640.1 hypothetical protein [Oceanisphaera pacifica]